ncbi:hypothetical protein HYW83_00255 [Candidatus Peregrinibacteria bacterium]|nr:hypothetical protein [Candidatus Peregrinibacteria bacterium]
MNPLNENQVEKILGHLPQFERSKKAERVFFEKLHRIAAQKTKIEAAETRSEASGWFSWPRLSFARLSLAGSLAALVLMTAGTVWAYQPSTTRGHFLYPWKQAAEKIEFAFSRTPLQKIDAHLRFSDRRLSEAENIIAKNPSLAWLAPAARAHEGEIHLETEEEIFLAETLEDMRKEVSAASEIIEVKISKPADARKALEKIEVAAERHVEVLSKIEKKSEEKIKKIVKRIVDEEDEHLAVIVEAREAVKAAEARKESKVTIQFKKREEKEEKRGGDKEKHEAKLENRAEEAKDEFKEVFEFFEKLPEEKKKELQEKMERAREALEEGKFGRTKGLSRAILNDIESAPEFLPKPPRKLFPNEWNPTKVPDPSFKPNSDFKKVPDNENIYGLNPLLSPPKLQPAKENPNDKFLMEIEEVKDSDGVFEKDFDDINDIEAVEKRYKKFNR